MSITEDYCDFETSKLLKEKGFLSNDRIYKAYNLKDKSLINSDGNFNYDTEIPAPTLQMAMKWLRETHNLHICIEPHSFSKNNKPVGYECTYWFNGSFYYPYVHRNHHLEYKVWDTYEDAVIETIKYCLTEI